MMEEERIIDSKETHEETHDKSLRPVSLEDFIGQSQLKDNLNVFLAAAKGRGDALDHVLLYGPPGLGKTTIAQIVAKEMNVNFKATAGPILTKAGDLAALLTNLEQGDVLFIDEIHRLHSTIEEVLYPAMEDYVLDLIIGEGPAARTVRIDLPKFTLVGATTRLGLLTNPLRDRFGIPLRLNFYAIDELQKVIERGARKLHIAIEEEGAIEIAKRSRGTPRIALRLLRRVRDFITVGNKDLIDKEGAEDALNRLEVDRLGLDSNDHRYLRFIAENYAGGPVGIETICAGLSEQRDSVEEAIEPYLLQQGFIQRTPRGRMLTEQAFNHLEIQLPKTLIAQLELIKKEE
ncbi:MAG: Holliday junction branch migration DNA helicase RuvB [Alphaproteobacteria bacterium]